MKWDERGESGRNGGRERRKGREEEREKKERSEGGWHCTCIRPISIWQSLLACWALATKKRAKMKQRQKLEWWEWQCYDTLDSVKWKLIEWVSEGERSETRRFFAVSGAMSAGASDRVSEPSERVKPPESEREKAERGKKKQAMGVKERWWEGVAFANLDARFMPRLTNCLRFFRGIHSLSTSRTLLWTHDARSIGWLEQKQG